MRLDELAAVSRGVAETRARLSKIDRLAAFLRRLRPDEVPVAVAYLSGVLPQGTIGVGWATLRDLPPAAPPPPTLELLEAHAALDRIRDATGPGSQGRRREAVAALFGRATDGERTFLAGLLMGELRQGALAGVMVEAVARAAQIPATEIRRALMLAGDLGSVAAAALDKGRAGLLRFRLAVGRPVQPMLAQSAADLEEALERVPRASVEWKIDGARIQAHKLGDEVRIFTRNLADITGRVPDLVDTLRAARVEDGIFDGEAIALRSDERPQPFQVTMSRFGSRLEVERMRRSVPLSVFLFDCLHAGGDDLIDHPAAERWACLVEVGGELVPRDLAVRLDSTRRFMTGALERGHEGVMVKALDAPYEAGRRGASWLKVKRAHTLDLVVLAAEWGHGRRRGWLSNLHLGARDSSAGTFVMLGKTFKGMTDGLLAWQTTRLLELETHRSGITVYVRPELVVEVAFDGLQQSPRYPGGLALRFARIKGYRLDRGPLDADTIDAVRALAVEPRPSQS
jgi:DNA ligase-1